MNDLVTTREMICSLLAQVSGAQLNEIQKQTGFTPNELWLGTDLCRELWNLGVRPQRAAPSTSQWALIHGSRPESWFWGFYKNIQVWSWEVPQ